MKVQGILVAAVCLLLCLAGCAGPRQTETTSSGESHSAESTAPLDDADFQQESAGFAPKDQMTEPFTVSTPIQEVIDDPIFGRYGRLLFPVDDWYMSGDTLGELQLTWYNNIDPNETVEIANTLWQRANAGETVFYDIYTEEEKAEDPDKEDTGLFFFKGDPGAKFAVCNAGGGFAYVGAMALSLAACGNSSSNETSAPETSDSAASSETQEPSAAPESAEPAESTEEPSSQPETEGEEGGTLVVYYSATGNTEQVANYIADITGGDLFELEPADPYTDEDLNYNNEDSRVSQEYADESLRDVELVADTVENWDSYDTVFIGYPIWWGIAAWPTDGFVEANDFTGKTVIPFCTSSSSGLGESGELLAELAGTGDWQEGMRFRSSVSEGDVQEWLDSLSLS